MPDVAALLDACRVPDSVPSGEFGLWTIGRLIVPEIVRGKKCIDPEVPAYTFLGRATMAALHQPYGEIVMEDTLPELRRHLPILLRGRGRILVSGLGLGCVVRGLLSKPDVEHVDVVEIDRTILEVVGPEFAQDPRVTLHEGCAIGYPWRSDLTWDYAWHDVWTEEGSLDRLHAELLARYRYRAKHQGAWQFHRPVKRIWPDRLLNGPRRGRRPAGRKKAWWAA